MQSDFFVKVLEDKNHVEAKKLYAKSNRFKFTQFNYSFPKDAVSLCFELYINNGKRLGICSAVTYFASKDAYFIFNWAVNNRFFDLGVEECVLNYLLKNIQGNFDIICQTNDSNQMVGDFISKYYGSVIMDDSSSVPNDSNVFIEFLPYQESTKKILREINDSIGCYSLYFIDDGYNVLEKNTNIKLCVNDSGMQMDKYFICLANSYKHGGRCIAGIEVQVTSGGYNVVKENGRP